jgi:O-glycosyl hydrolase
MYLNVDGKGGRFGNTGVQASSADPDRLSVYAARRGRNGALTLMAINKTGTKLTSTIALAHFDAAASAKAWRYGAARPTAIQHLKDVPVTGNTIQATLPANSITLFVVPVAK